MSFLSDDDSDHRGLYFPQQNIFRLIQSRSTQPYSVNRVRKLNHRVYEHIVPNTTVYGIAGPAVYYKRFTPDGKYLLTISQSQVSLVIYEFRGYNGCDETTDNFSTYFTKKGEIQLTNRPSCLCKDFCLFTESNDFVILASSCNENSTSESNSPSTETREETTFHLIHIEQVKEYDKIVRKNDGIFIMNHVGVSICQDRFSILGLFSQQMAFYRIHPDGKFIFIKEMGKYCYEDDELIMSQQKQAEEMFLKTLEQTEGRQAIEKMEQVEQPVTGSGLHAGHYPVLIQRILVFLFRRSQMPEYAESSSGGYRNMFLLFNQFSNLIVVKMQFLDTKHIMIKLCHKEFIYNRSADLAIQAALLVVMNIENTQVIGIYENSSQELYDLLISNMELLRDVVSSKPIFVGSSSNNHHVRHYFEKRKKNLISCKNGGIINAHRRILFGFPCSPNIIGQSPYFDQDLYVYDERTIVGCDRNKSGTDMPTKFNLRRGNTFKFQLDPTSSTTRSSGRSGRSVAYVFHPHLPFVISVQQPLYYPAVVNFHFRCERAELPGSEQTDSQSTM